MNKKLTQEFSTLNEQNHLQFQHRFSIDESNWFERIFRLADLILAIFECEPRVLDYELTSQPHRGESMCRQLYVLQIHQFHQDLRKL